MEDLNDVEEGYAISRPSTDMELHDAIPVDLQLLLSVLAIDTEPAKSAQNVFDMVKQSFGFASADLLAATVRKRLADYKTTIGEDDDLIRRLNNISSAQVASGAKLSRYRMAVQVRKGEKEILQRVLELAQQFITSNTNGKRKRDINDAGPTNARKATAKG